MQYYRPLLLLVLLGHAAHAASTEPTLARLAFIGLPPERLEQFEDLYQERLLPLLAPYGLVEYPESGRATPDSVFSRLFAVASPRAVVELGDSLAADSTWQQSLTDLGTALQTDPPRWRLDLYHASDEWGHTTRAVGKGHWRTFDSRDGIATNVTGNIFQDRDGYLWIATLDGVSRFDGQRFDNFTVDDGLADNLTVPQWQDSNGHIWFTSGQMGEFKIGKGVTRYDGQRFETFTTQDGLADNTVAKIFEDSAGRLWFATRGGVSRLDPAAAGATSTDRLFTTFTSADGLADNFIFNVWGHGAEDRRGHIWFSHAFRTAGVSRYDGRAFTTFTSADGLVDSAIHSIHLDRDGDPWFLSWGQGATHFDGVTWTSFSTRDGLIDDRVYTVFAASDGHLWFGTYGGVSRYDGHTWTNFTAPDHLAANSTTAITQDSTGVLWFTAYSAGASSFDGHTWRPFSKDVPNSNVYGYHKLRDRRGNWWFSSATGLHRYSDEWTAFTAADGLPEGTDRTYSIAQDQRDHLWFGTGAGAARFDGIYMTAYPSTDGLISASVWGLLLDRAGALWLGGSPVNRFDGKNWTTFSSADGLVDGFIFTLAQTDDGALWFGGIETGKGISRFNGQTWSTFTTEDGLADNHVLSSTVDSRDNLWLGFLSDSGTGGVSRFDGETWTNFTTQDGLAHNRVKWILEDDQGRYWFATADGASRYDGQTWTNFTRRDGLADNFVETIFQDRAGHLWFGTNGGVSRYDGQVFQSLTQRDGLGGNAVWWIHQDDQGQYWFATNGGVTRFRPAPPAPPPVAIEAVVADQRYESVNSLTLDTGPSLVAVEYGARSFRTRPEAMVYRYRLRGHEEDWTNTHTRRVEYAQLPVGEYTFEVVAVDRDLVYSEEPASVHLTIRPQTFTSPLRLAAVELDDVFASLAASYRRRGLGQVRVANDGVETLQTTLRFFLPQLMRQPLEVPLDLAPGAIQQVALHPQLDIQIPDQTQPQTPAAQVSLELPEFSVKANPAPQLTLYPPGALRWDGVAPAAAFITSNAPQVAAFARPSLLAFESETGSWGKPLENVAKAMVLFEALKTHGVRYIADANTPYARARANQATVDHIQYPAETLHSKTGDCDDLTVLYAALLENAGIATALVDYPGHIFLLVDTGVPHQTAYRLPLETQRYVAWGKTLWVPVEITQLDRSFEQAWRLGADQLAGLSGLELRQRLVRTVQAWQDYPATAPSFAGPIEPPARTAFQTAFDQQYAVLQSHIHAHIEETYLDPLKIQPDNDALRTRLLKLYLALHQFDTAIQTGLTNLLDKRGNKGSTHNNLGIAYFLKGEFTQAALQFEQAVQLQPDDRGVQKNLQRALQALGRAVPGQQPVAEVASGDGSRAATTALVVDSFYWME
ncbi:MAG: hypothetical protein GKR89_30445 [Candidatus Latescibacteria bacterium]|nr:hypothetical protein [Candidatus Latescibacterota bacterium]